MHIRRTLPVQFHSVSLTVLKSCAPVSAPRSAVMTSAPAVLVSLALGSARAQRGQGVLRRTRT